MWPQQMRCPNMRNKVVQINERIIDPSISCQTPGWGQARYALMPTIIRRRNAPTEGAESSLRLRCGVDTETEQDDDIVDEAPAEDD